VSFPFVLLPNECLLLLLLLLLDTPSYYEVRVTEFAYRLLISLPVSQSVSQSFTHSLCLWRSWEIWGIHGGEDSRWSLLGCDGV